MAELFYMGGAVPSVGGRLPPLPMKTINKKEGDQMLPAMEAPRGTAPREGELYKKIQIAGKTFPLYYGYYEEFEREHHEPMPIYPDFIQNPEYTDEGLPIVTAMQDACPRHQGPAWSDSCHHCIHFRPQEELFGLCACLQNRQCTDLTTKRNPQGG